LAFGEPALGPVATNIDFANTWTQILGRGGVKRKKKGQPRGLYTFTDGPERLSAQPEEKGGKERGGKEA